MIIKFDTKKLLKEKQREIFLNESRFKVVAAGRRAGRAARCAHDPTRESNRHS